MAREKAKIISLIGMLSLGGCNAEDQRLDHRTANHADAGAAETPSAFPGDPSSPVFPAAPSPRQFDLNSTYRDCTELQSDVRAALLYKKASDEAQALASTPKESGTFAESVNDDFGSGDQEETEDVGGVDNAQSSVIPTDGETPFTNVQETKVDEPDHTKVGQDHIFVMSSNGVEVSDRSSLRSIGRLSLTAQPQELLVSKSFLFVLSVTRRSECFDDEEVEAETGDNAEPGLMSKIASQLSHFLFPKAYAEPSWEPEENFECYTVAETTISAFRLVKNELPRLEKAWSFKGDYVDSRMLEDGRIVLVFNQMLNLHDDVRGVLTNPYLTLGDIPERPIVLDDSGNGTTMGCASIHKGRLDDMDFRLTKVAVVHTADFAKAPAVAGFLGGSDQIYMTTKNLYLSKYGRLWDPYRAQAATTSSNDQSGTDVRESLRVTQVSLETFGQMIETPADLYGRIKDVWAFKEYVKDGSTRLALFTSTGDLWNAADNAENQLWILKQESDTLAIETSIQGIAKGEDIRSVRYVGDWAYAVTFKRTDPLFAFDLTVPSQPRLVGELKIPGFSTYMHPVGEGLIVGLGYDVLVDAKANDEQSVKFQGIKLSLFDVSDPVAMKELDTKILGQRGSYSDAVNDHHGFMFDAKTNRIAFPVTLLSSESETQPWEEQRDVIFSGAIMFEVSGDRLVEAGRFSHASYIPEGCQSLMARGQWWQYKARSLDINRIYRVDNGYLTTSRFGLQWRGVDNISPDPERSEVFPISASSDECAI